MEGVEGHYKQHQLDEHAGARKNGVFTSKKLNNDLEARRPDQAPIESDEPIPVDASRDRARRSVRCQMGVEPQRQDRSSVIDDAAQRRY